MKTITVDYLIKNKACKEVITFVKNNNLDNLSIEKLKEVRGDFNNFKSWILKDLKTIKKYDDNGNVIAIKHPWGNEYYWEYNYYPNNQLKSINENGKEILFIPEVN